MATATHSQGSKIFQQFSLSPEVDPKITKNNSKVYILYIAFLAQWYSIDLVSRRNGDRFPHALKIKNLTIIIGEINLALCSCIHAAYSLLTLEKKKYLV